MNVASYEMLVHANPPPALFSCALVQRVRDTYGDPFTRRRPAMRQSMWQDDIVWVVGSFLSA
jgi:hypothetical protein